MGHHHFWGRCRLDSHMAAMIMWMLFSPKLNSDSDSDNDEDHDDNEASAARSEGDQRSWFPNLLTAEQVDEQETDVDKYPPKELARLQRKALRDLYKAIDESSDKLFFIRYREQNAEEDTYRLVQADPTISFTTAMHDYGIYRCKFWDKHRKDAEILPTAHPADTGRKSAQSLRMAHLPRETTYRPTPSKVISARATDYKSGERKTSIYTATKNLYYSYYFC